MAFHGVQVSQEEVGKLRQVTDIVRMGRVRAVRAQELELERGSVQETAGTLYINCTSSWIRNAPEPVPIFQEKKIVLQLVEQVRNGVGDFNTCYQASFTAFLEAHFPEKQDWKNSVCTPAKPVDNHVDWLRSQLTTACVGGRLWESAKVVSPKVLSFLMSCGTGIFANLRPDNARKWLQLANPSEIFKANLSRMVNDYDKQDSDLNSPWQESGSEEKCIEKPDPFSRQATGATIDDEADALTSIGSESCADGSTDFADTDGLDEITAF
jgi:hypothetical protein